MPVHAVTYDLKVKNDDDAAVIKALKNNFTSFHLQESVWLIDTPRTVAEVRDALDVYLKPGDKLFVAKLEGSWATQNAGNAAVAWLKSNARTW